MKLITRFAMTAFTVTALLPVAAMAGNTQNTKEQGYVVDSSSGVAMSGTGLCWHDSRWTQAGASEPCDPSNKQMAEPTAFVEPTTPKAAEPFVYVAPEPVAKKVAKVEPYEPQRAMVEAAPVQPLPQKVSFSDDALFAFDKSVLSPAGKTMLDSLVLQLNGTKYDTIRITGHTDRFGKRSYNQKLSERRAHVVKDYLVSSNVQANRIDAEGKGSTQPVTKRGDCRGRKSAKVIACLQADRRADVEMTGMTTP